MRKEMGKVKNVKRIKGIICAVTASASVFGTAASAAGTEELYTAMSGPVYSAEMTMTMTMSLDSISDELREAVMDIAEDIKPEIKYDIDAVYDMSEDGKVMKMAMDMTMSIPGEENITVSEYIDMDISDEENMKYTVITKTPEDDKYYYMDYSSMTGDISSVLGMAGSDEMKEFAEKLAETVPQKEPEYKDGVYSLTYSQQELLDMLKATMLAGEDIYLPMFAQLMPAAAELPAEGIIAGADEPTAAYVTGDDAVAVGADEPTNVYVSGGLDAETYRAETEKWYGILSGVKLFAEDAVTLDVTLDENDVIKSMDMGMYIETNLYDTVTKIAEAIGTPEEDLAEFSEYVTPENSDIKASLVMSCEYSNVNGDVKVDIPELNEENSVDMLSQVTEPETIYAELETKTVDGMELIPLRAFCNAAGITDENITYDDGVVTITVKTRDPELTVTVIIDDTTVTAVGSDGSRSEMEMQRPAVLINDRTYVTSDFALSLGYVYQNGMIYMWQNAQ